MADSTGTVVAKPSPAGVSRAGPASKPSIKSVSGMFSFAFDTLKMLYRNELTRYNKSVE